MLIEKIVDLKAIMLSLFYGIGYFANGVFLQLQTESGWIDLILGPLGALALSVIALYFLWNYMRKKDEVIKKIRDEQLADKEKQIEELKKELSKLKRK